MENTSYEQSHFIKTGVYGLDEILLGGITQGNVVVVEGMPGSGKSTLATEFIYRGATQFNEPGIIVNFESSPEKIMRDARNCGWDLKSLEEKALIKILHISPVSLMAEMHTRSGLLFNEMEKIKAKRIVIDGLAPFKLVGEAERAKPFRDSMQSMLDAFFKSNVTLLLTTETTNTNPIGESAAGVEQYLADTVITLRNQARRRSVHRSIEITKSRGQDFVAGRHTFTIGSECGIKVYPRAYARPKIYNDQPTSFERSPVGVQGLDLMLNGGVYDGSITLVVGISGTGKTIAGMHFLSEGAKLGKKGLMVTLDEHPKQICRNADVLKLPFTKEVENGNIFIHFDSPLELDIDKHFHQIRNLIEENKIERVVIDSIAAYERAQPEDSREFIVSLAAYLKSQLVTAYFNFECPELLGVSKISENINASAVADNIMLFNYVEISTLLRRAVTIPKARGTKVDHRTHEFVISEGGITLLEDKASEVQPVPQLPLSSYYGVLARSPTRHSPIIDEHVATGKPLPKSKVPKVDASKKRQSEELKRTQ